jgi:hypothetical protein
VVPGGGEEVDAVCFCVGYPEAILRVDLDLGGVLELSRCGAGGAEAAQVVAFFVEDDDLVFFFVGEVGVAIGVDVDGGGAGELFCADPLDQLTALREALQAGEFRNPDRAVFADRDPVGGEDFPRGRSERAPLGEELALG